MKQGQRGRGFNSFRKHIEENKSGRYIASCSSCRFQDPEDGCTNSNVTSFDVVKDGDRTYCPYWKGYEAEGKRKTKKQKESEW